MELISTRPIPLDRASPEEPITSLSPFISLVARLAQIRPARDSSRTAQGAHDVDATEKYFEAWSKLPKQTPVQKHKRINGTSIKHQRPQVRSANSRLQTTRLTQTPCRTLMRTGFSGLRDHRHQDEGHRPNDDRREGADTSHLLFRSNVSTSQSRIQNTRSSTPCTCLQRQSLKQNSSETPCSIPEAPRRSSAELCPSEYRGNNPAVVNLVPQFGWMWFPKVCEDQQQVEPYFK